MSAALMKRCGCQLQTQVVRLHLFVLKGKCKVMLLLLPLGHIVTQIVRVLVLSGAISHAETFPEAHRGLFGFLFLQAALLFNSIQLAYSTLSVLRVVNDHASFILARSKFLLL